MFGRALKALIPHVPEMIESQLLVHACVGLSSLGTRLPRGGKSQAKIFTSGQRVVLLYPNVSNAFDRAGFISLKISVLWILVLKVQTSQQVTLQN